MIDNRSRNTAHPSIWPALGFLRRLRSVAVFAIYLALVAGVVDVVVLHGMFGFGYPRHYEQENVLRYPAPFVEFTGVPGSHGHDEFGFPGPPISEASPGSLTIAFFAGSTGYNGNPPIPVLLEIELERLLATDVDVSNYSVVSSNHRQHLHGIVEYLHNAMPDIVIFYGGYNETVQNALYDPRPGYPYNFFYRAETAPWKKVLLENSAVCGAIDMRFGWLSGIDRLRDQQRPLSADWNRRIVEKYMETLSIARNLTAGLGSKRYGSSVFISIYQPFRYPAEFAPAHQEIRDRIGELWWAFDFSTEREAWGDGMFTDAVHIRQEGRAMLAEKLARQLVEVVRDGDNEGGALVSDRK